MPGAVVAVTAPTPAAVRDELQQMPGVSSLLVVGDGVHLVVDDAERRLPEIRERLRAAAIPFSEVVQVAPTIEDLFVASVGSQGGGGS
jgi:ABC-2 type transport system ATP-binding protein